MVIREKDLLRLRYKIICKTGSLGPFCRTWGVSPKCLDPYIRGCITDEDAHEIATRLERGLACV